MGTQSKLDKDAGSEVCFAHQRPRTPIQSSYACSWSPHSVFSVPAQRPSRPDPGFVHGAQPIEE